MISGDDFPRNLNSEPCMSGVKSSNEFSVFYNK